MPECGWGECSITKEYTCCFECPEEVFEKCNSEGCICDKIIDRDVDRKSYESCPYYED